MYSDLYELTTAFTAYVERSYNNARRLERLYGSLDEESSLHDYASAAESAWFTYDNTVRQGSAIVARFKALFSDPSATNAEVRRAAKEAIAELRQGQAEEDRTVRAELSATEVAAGLVECAALMESSPAEYITEGKKTYGTDISSGESSSAMGVLGTAVMVVIGLLCVVYGAFTGFHIMKGSRSAETLLTRLLVFFVFAIIVILAIQMNL